MPANYPGSPPQLVLPEDNDNADAESVNRGLRSLEATQRALQHLPFMELGLDDTAVIDYCTYRLGGPDFVIARRNGDLFISNGTVRENGITQNIDDWDAVASPSLSGRTVSAVAASSTRIIAAGLAGLILTDDTSWHVVSPGSSYTGNFNGVAYAPNGGIFYVCGQDGEIQSGSGAGAFTRRLSLGASYAFTHIAGIAGPSSDYLLAAGSGPGDTGIIYHAETGSDWEQIGVDGDFPYLFRAFCMSEDGRAFGLYRHDGTNTYHIAYNTAAAAPLFATWSDEDTGIPTADYWLTSMCHVAHSDLLVLGGCVGSLVTGFPGVVLLGNVGGRPWVPAHAPQHELYGAAAPSSAVTIESVTTNGRRILATGRNGAGFYTNGAVLREPV